jgi:HEPN domain-containing protein
MGPLLAGQGAQRSALGRGPSALPDPAIDTALYHCQQTAEKALKAFLALHDQSLERTHDLERLLELAARLDSDFAELAEASDVLNPYATAFRYPSLLELPLPTVAEVTGAVEHAQSVYAFVLERIPPEARPS